MVPQLAGPSVLQNRWLNYTTPDVLHVRHGSNPVAHMLPLTQVAIDPAYVPVSRPTGKRASQAPMKMHHAHSQESRLCGPLSCEISPPYFVMQHPNTCAILLCTWVRFQLQVVCFCIPTPAAFATFVKHGKKHLAYGCRYCAMGGILYCRGKYKKGTSATPPH